MTRQRLRGIERRNAQIVSDGRPRTRSEWLHEHQELAALLDEIGAILLTRLEANPNRSSTENALYYYLMGTVRR